MFAFLFAMAQSPANGQQGSGGSTLRSTLMGLLPMIAIFLILYLLILRPQTKRQRQHQQMMDSIEKGDKIVTSGGIHGVVLRVNKEEGTIQVKIADDVKVELDRNAISRKLKTG